MKKIYESRINLSTVVERCTCMHAMQRPVVQVSQWATIFSTQESGCCQIHICDNMITESDPTREGSGSCDQQLLSMGSASIDHPTRKPSAWTLWPLFNRFPKTVCSARHGSETSRWTSIDVV